MGEMGAMSSSGDSGGGFDWMSMASKIGDINQKSVDQDWNTSYSVVSDPAGWLYNQGYFGLTNRDKDRKAQQELQNRLTKQQIKSLELSNEETIRRKKWNTNFRRYMLGGKV